MHGQYPEQIRHRIGGDPAPGLPTELDNSRHQPHTEQETAATSMTMHIPQRFFVALVSAFWLSGTAQVTAQTTAVQADSLMDDAFAVPQGAADAPNTLIFVHAGSDLGQDFNKLNQEQLDEAIGAGQLRVVNLFTFTGKDSSIWANLALICGGAKAYPATRAALLGDAGKAALSTIDDTGDQAPLRALIGAAYDSAGLEAGLVDYCAFDRGHALRYLAEWNRAQDTYLGQGADIYTIWPSLVLNGTQMPVETVNAWLSAFVASADQAKMQDNPNQPTPVPPAAPVEVATPTAPEALDAPALVQVPALAAPEAAPDTADNPAPLAPAPAPVVAETAPEAPAETTPPDLTLADQTPDLSPMATTAPPPKPAAAPVTALTTRPPYPAPAASAVGRIPSDQCGVWGHSLADCLGYMRGLDQATTLDQTLPMPDAEPPEQALVLITSQNLSLFDKSGTECLLDQEEASGDSFAALYNCAAANGRSAPALELTGLPPRQQAPRLDMRLGTNPGTEMRQCHTLGQLSRIAAPLWQIDSETCQATAPLSTASFRFHPGTGGTLILSVKPAAELPGGDALYPGIAVDGTVISSGQADWTGDGWDISLGQVGDAARAVSRGMFLEARLSEGSGDALYRLPLLGSSQAMKAVTGCNSDGN